MSIDEKCKETIKSSRIKVEEHGRKAIFLNPKSETFIKIRVDGCVCKNETSADFIVAKKTVGDVIIELKGKDVEKASKQIIATAEMWQKNKLREGDKMAGLIVASQFPRINTTIQKLKNQFANKFKGPIHVVTQNNEYNIECLFSFKGPLRL